MQKKKEEEEEEEKKPKKNKLGNSTTLTTVTFEKQQSHTFWPLIQFVLNNKISYDSTYKTIV